MLKLATTEMLSGPLSDDDRLLLEEGANTINTANARRGTKRNIDFDADFIRLISDALFVNLSVYPPVVTLMSTCPDAQHREINSMEYAKMGSELENKIFLATHGNCPKYQ
jgi:hypothetical protein